MKIGDLVKAWAISDHKRHGDIQTCRCSDHKRYIGVVTAITLAKGMPETYGKYRFKVFFPNAPRGWWNSGTWNKKALELV